MAKCGQCEKMNIYDMITNRRIEVSPEKELSQQQELVFPRYPMVIS